MKKLMILGGSRYAIPVIKSAHELGIYVITCDYLPENVAHRYSDEYCNASIVDKELVLKKARELQIDGITSFGCDPGVVTAAFVAEKMGLPSVGSYESVCILQNKGRFRHFLEENGFNVPVAKSYTCIDDAIKDVELFHWPVIVKPTDSAGSKGVTKVENASDLSRAIKCAIDKSFSNEFIIEDFIEKKGCSSDTDSFSIEGRLSFVSFNAQRFDVNASNPYAPAAYSWPSTMSEEHENELKSEIQRLISLLGLKTSIYNIETREGIDGKAYIMECSPRGGGNRLAEMLRYATGVDLIKATVLSAVGEPVDDVKQKPYKGFWGIAILHSDNSGRFEKLLVDEEIQKYVIEEDLWVKPGEWVDSFNAANNAIGTVVFRFESKEMMEEYISEIDKYVRIISK